MENPGRGRQREREMAKVTERKCEARTDLQARKAMR